jgi:hypothetical protein
MKKYIKDNKIYTAPLKIQKEIEVIEKQKDKDGKEIEVKVKKTVFSITNNEKDIIAAGYKVYVPPVITPTSGQLLERAVLRINQETDKKILNDFVYKDNEFYLTTENQTNFANLFIARDFMEYPQLVKTKTGFMEIKNAGEVSGFYLSGVNFIKTCLEEGWKKKAEAEAEIISGYQNETKDNIKAD